MYGEVERDLIEMGTEIRTETMQDKYIADDDDYTTKEIIGYQYAIKDTSDVDELIHMNKGSIEWCFAEIQERIGGIKLNPGNAWQIRRKVWEEFA